MPYFNKILPAVNYFVMLNMLWYGCRKTRLFPSRETADEVDSSADAVSNIGQVILSWWGTDYHIHIRKHLTNDTTLVYCKKNIFSRVSNFMSAALLHIHEGLNFTSMLIYVNNREI